MGKFKMPTVQEFVKKKKIYWRKREPVWIYLEREMRANLEQKPYNEKVGEWLKFLRDLHYYFYCEAKRKYRRLNREAGPAWYYELSAAQRQVLQQLKSKIHQDLLEDLPIRIRKSLSDLGITLRIPKAVLMKTMLDSCEDPGVFIWYLFTAVYKNSPSALLPHYDMNAMILMSSLVFIDLDECIEKLDKLAFTVKPPPPPPKKKPPKYYQPKVRYGEYLQKMYVPLYCNHPSEEEKKWKKKPLELGCKIRLRSEESYERLCMDHSFLEKRIDRNKQEKPTERVCHYKFWEPPSTLRNTDPKMAAYVIKLKMFKLKARARHMKYKAPFDIVQFHIGTVSYTGGRPRFLLNNISTMPTGYIPLNAGIVRYNGENITHIQGYWKYPRHTVEKCEETCDCLTKWESTVTEYLNDSKCKCGHLYDLYNEGKAKEKYFYPPSRHFPMWFDQAKIYQMDPTEDFIKDTFKEALKSRSSTPEPSLPSISASGLKEKELLATFLADLAHTPLLIPHLPEANLLNNLQEWVRQRVKGAITPRKHKQWKLQSQRRWLDLKHMDFRARAYLIPFTLKQLEHINWSHRYLIQRLFENLMNDFVTRNRLKQVEQTRMLWSTMKFDAYPSKAFLDIYFTYMPGRMKDTFLINPYSSDRTPKTSGKTCPLN